MIQRPQTLFYLAIVAICLMLIFSNTVFYQTTGDEGTKVSVEYDETELVSKDDASKEANTWLVSFLVGVAVLAVVALAMFKNRKLQSLLSAFNYLFILGLVVMMYMYSMNMDYFNSGTSGFTFSALMPLALLFFNFLAMRGVKKDELLIRSMDRLR